MSEAQQVIAAITVSAAVILAFVCWTIGLVLNSIHETNKLIIRMNGDILREQEDVKKMLGNARKAYWRQRG